MHFENDTDLYRVIGANIKHYREQAKLTQVQLAERAKISISYLSKIISNKSIAFSKLTSTLSVFIDSSISSQMLTISVQRLLNLKSA